MEKKPQKERLREYLDTGKSISSPEARMLLQISNLSTVVTQLRKDGYATSKETLYGENVVGDWVYTIRYSKSDHKF